MIEIDINNSKILTVENQGLETLLNGSPANYEVIKISDSSFKVIGERSIYEVDLIEHREKEMKLSINNNVVDLTISDHMDQILEKLGMDNIQSSVIRDVKAPMPGSILEILVEEGTEVQTNDQLLVLEAMKMENVIKSPGEGIVSKIHIASKENVEKNQVLISFE